MTGPMEDPSVDIDRLTGGDISGWEHVIQSIEDIMTTRFGERVMRRWYGSLVPQILGNNLTAPVVVRFFSAVGAALEQEPRVRLVQMLPLVVTRSGSLTVQMNVAYRPRALLGDFTETGYRVIARSLPWLQGSRGQ